MRMSVFFFFQAEDGIRDLVRSRGLGDVYKRQVLQAPMLFSVPKVELNLESQAIIVNQFVVGEREIAAEQGDMGASLRLQMRFEDNHDVERLAKLSMQASNMVHASFDLVFNDRLFQVFDWQVLVIQLVAVFAVRPMPFVRALSLIHI